MLPAPVSHIYAATEGSGYLPDNTSSLLRIPQRQPDPGNCIIKAK